MTLTNLLILLNVLAFIYELGTGALSNERALYRDGALYGLAVTQGGQWWRIVTGAFLHGSIPHIALNMIALFQVGSIVEVLYGKPRYLLVYIIAMVGSGLLVVYLTPNLLTVGASGAIFGLFGALVAAGIRMGKRGRQLVQGTVPVIVLNLIFTFTFPGISWAAQVGGLGFGFLAGLVLFMGTPYRRQVAYAYPYPAQNDPSPVETIEQPPEAGAHEEADAPPLHVRDPRE